MNVREYRIKEIMMLEFLIKLIKENYLLFQYYIYKLNSNILSEFFYI